MLKFYLSLSALTLFGVANAASLTDLREKILCVSPSQEPGEQENRFFESFEAWDNTTTDWLPADWTEIVSDKRYEEMNDGVFTWHVGTQSGTTPFAIDGSNYAVIYYAYEKDAEGKTIDLPQDEWLIIPPQQIISGDHLNFYLGYSPMFLFDMNNENINWSNMDFITRKPSATLKVCVRESETDEWTEIFDIYNEWEDTSLEELFNNYMDSQFRQYDFDLSDYAGETIEIAFRYVGKYGNTMEIDAVSIKNDVPAQNDTPTYTISVSPLPGEITKEQMASFVITFEGVNYIEFNPMGVYGNLFKIDDEGNFIEDYQCVAELTSDNAYTFTPYNPPTEAGKYRLTIPQRAVFVTDTEGVYGPNEEHVFDYTLTDTGIGGIDADATDLTVYSIDGVCVLHNAKTTDLKILAKGIYIVNGQKIIIR